MTFTRQWQWATPLCRAAMMVHYLLHSALKCSTQHSANLPEISSWLLILHFTTASDLILVLVLVWVWRGPATSNIQQTRRAYLQHTISDTAQHTVSTAYNIKTSNAPSLPADPQSMSRVIQATDTTPSTLGQGRGRSRE